MVKEIDVLRNLSTDFVNQSAVAKKLQVSRQRVHTLIRNLSAQRLIERNRKGEVRLSAAGLSLIKNTPLNPPQPYEQFTKLIWDAIHILANESEDQKRAELETFLVDYALHTLFLAVMVEAGNASNEITPNNIEESLDKRWNGKLKEVMAWTATLLLASQNRGWDKYREVFAVIKGRGEYLSHVLDRIFAERLTQTDEG